MKKKTKKIYLLTILLIGLLIYVVSTLALPILDKGVSIKVTAADEAEAISKVRSFIAREVSLETYGGIYVDPTSNNQVVLLIQEDTDKKDIARQIEETLYDGQSAISVLVKSSEHHQQKLSDVAREIRKEPSKFLKKKGEIISVAINIRENRIDIVVPNSTDVNMDALNDLVKDDTSLVVVIEGERNTVDENGNPLSDPYAIGNITLIEYKKNQLTVNKNIPIIVNSETIIKNSKDETIQLADLKKGDKISVWLSSPASMNSASKGLATLIKVK